MVVRVEGWGQQGVASHDGEVLDAVQEHVHPGDGLGGQVALLTPDDHVAPLTATLTDMLDRLQQHAARPARRVVDALTGQRIEDVDHQLYHRTRGVELARRPVAAVGELLDQVFVGLPHYVAPDVAVAQPHTVELAEQPCDQGVGQAVLIGPLRVPEDAVQGVGVGPLDVPESAGERVADVLGAGEQVAPVAVLRDLEAVVLGEGGEGRVAVRLVQRGLILLVPDIADASWVKPVLKGRKHGPQSRAGKGEGGRHLWTLRLSCEFGWQRRWGSTARAAPEAVVILSSRWLKLHWCAC